MMKKQELLQDIIKKLRIFQDQSLPMARIEKDIILQLLREAYVLTVEAETEDTVSLTHRVPIKPVPKTEPHVAPLAEDHYPETREEAEVPEENEFPEFSEEDEFPEEDELSEEVDTPETSEENEPHEEDNDLPEIFEEDETPDETPEEPYPIEDTKDFAIREPEPEILPSDLFNEDAEDKAEDKAEVTPVQQQPPRSEKVGVFSNMSPVRSLNDLLQEQTDNHSVYAQYQQTKVADLAKSISINDKFLFIRELFNNKGEEFSVALQDLNCCTSLEQAFDMIEHLKETYFWDSASQAYLKLCDLVRRKF
jgi:hypothetical protein